MSSHVDELATIGISVQEKDTLVAQLVRYMLFKTVQNKGCPIKREELTRIITDKGYKQYNLPNFIIKEAKSKLSTIFGYDMRELQRSRPSSATTSTQQSETKSYVIISQLPADAYKKYVENQDSSHVAGFTFVVLGIVHLAGGKITTENLWHHLRRLGLSDTEESSVLGNTKQALDNLVQQRYLQKDKVNGPEPTLYYEFAERAQDEEVARKIKDYVTQMATQQKQKKPMISGSLFVRDKGATFLPLLFLL